MNCINCSQCKVTIPILLNGQIGYEDGIVRCKLGHWRYARNGQNQKRYGKNCERTLKYMCYVSGGNGNTLYAVGENERADMEILRKAEKCQDFESMEDT